MAAELRIEQSITFEFMDKSEKISEIVFSTGSDDSEKKVRSTLDASYISSNTGSFVHH